jgi:hypothetical protein
MREQREEERDWKISIMRYLHLQWGRYSIPP